MGKKTTEHQIHIEAPPQACFDALIDYKNMPKWQSTIKSAKVIEHHENGVGKVVDWEVDAKIKKVRYVLDYTYEEPHKITWDYVEGDVKNVDGHYHLEEQSDGTTMVSLSLIIDPGMWVPGKIVNMLNDQVMGKALEDLKKRVESLVSKKGKRPRKKSKV